MSDMSLACVYFCWFCASMHTTCHHASVIAMKLSLPNTCLCMDDDVQMSEIARVLRPGGIFVGTTVMKVLLCNPCAA